MTLPINIQGYLNEYHGIASPITDDVIFAGRPKGYVTGCMPRSSEGVAFFDPYMGSFVHEIKWREIEPTEGSFDEVEVAKLQTAVDWATENNRTMRLRLFTGSYSPDWIKSEAGSLPWYSYSPLSGATYFDTVPIWWSALYGDLYKAYMERLVILCAAMDPVVDVTISQNMTIFAEPMIRQWGSAENVVSVRDAGYTVEQDITAMKRSIDTHRDTWAAVEVGSSFAFNPWSEPANLEAGLAGGRPNLPVSFELMDYLCTTLGRCGILQNNSIGDPIGVRGPRYEQFWAYMVNKRAASYPFPQPLAFQSMNTRVMKENGSTSFDTLQMVADFKAMALELPQGWTTDDPDVGITLEQATAFNAQFATNVQELQE